MDENKALELLNNKFGFEVFRKGQAEIIDILLKGDSALAVFPTGSGKSLCYQLPAICFDGVTLVISPLIALMKDQVEFLQSKGIEAARLDSTLDFAETTAVYDNLRQGKLKLLFIAPERLSNERFAQLLNHISIDLMVIDEAHCISEWGHNFRPDYLKLAQIARSLNVPRVLTLTATANPKVAEDICRAFQIKEGNYINTGFYRPNLTLSFGVCEKGWKAKLELLKQRLQTNPAGPTIVYTTLQKTAESVSSFLVNAGFDARPYHAGMKNDVRESTQDWFMKSNRAIVVATIAFGMGIDKADIRTIYHFNMPKSLENYSQEIGRAGRDGAPSFCEAFLTSSDMITLENFVYGDTPDQESVSGVVDYLLSHEGELSLSKYELSNRFDIRPLVINTLLTYMELKGVIESIAPYYDSYQFIPEESFDAISARFDDSRAKFLLAFFGRVRVAKKWCHADLDDIAAEINEPRDRLVKALTYLEEKGLLTLKATGLKHKYRIFSTGVDRNALISELVERFYDSEKREIQRLHDMSNMVNHEGCKTKYLLNYFGESLDRDCGHCDYCLNKRNSGFKRLIPEETDQQQIKEMIQSAKSAFQEQPTSRQIARFLCGISSPAITRQRLKSNPLFGRCEQIPFEQVLAFAKAIVST